MLVKTFILLSLLCLSLHACNARRFAHHKKLDQKFQDDRKGISVAAKEAFPLKNHHAYAAKEDSIAEIPAKNNTQKLKSSKATATQNLMKDKRAKRSGVAVQKESFVAVSWRVTQNKHTEKHPGFNLDYSLPRTHPPTHN